MSQHAGALAGVWRWVGNYALPDGGFVARSEANRYDTIRQILSSQHRYDEYRADGTLRRTSLHVLELGYLYPNDVRRLLTEAGFAGISISGGFSGRPLLADTDEMIVEASRHG